ncbi:MAG: diguanylate cyclase [Alteromonas sp. Nap_26]|nr:MAG: diguanylate cyclase [Alteromonas sp. Nap_26]
MKKPAVSKAKSQSEYQSNAWLASTSSHASLFERLSVMRLSGITTDIFIVSFWLAIWQVGRIVEYTDHASVWFPAAGFTFSCFLVIGIRASLPIMIAAILTTLWNGHHYELALSDRELIWGGVLFGFAHMLPYYVGASLLSFLARKQDITTPQLIVSFLLIGCISSLLTTKLVLVSLVFSGQMAMSEISIAFLPFWIGDMAGVVVLAPLLAGMLTKFYINSKIDLLPFSQFNSPSLASFFKKVSINLLLIFFIMLLAKLTGSRDSAFAIFFLAITHMWIACTESPKLNVISLAISSVFIVLLVHFFSLMDHVKVYQFALNVIAANALFGIAIPQLQADNQLLKDRVFIDTLTQAYTREYLTQRAELEIAQSHESGSPLFFVIFDLDKFKLINDELGHIDGDHALKRLSATTKAILRKTDIFARYGGDEFVLLLPDITEDKALKLVDKIRTAINAITVARMKLSSSFGITKLAPEDTLESLIKRADTALYVSKKEGGNSVTLG